MEIQKSSHWINRNELIHANFNWQKGFGVFTIGKCDIEPLKAYICNQKEVHKNLTFREEYLQYLKLNLL